MMIGFGIDLAGFSKHRSTVLAIIQAEECQAEVVLLEGSPFGRRLSDTEFVDRLKSETAALQKLLKIGPVAIDVPIDLQGLPLRRVTEAWQLTKRPVDEEFDALPPLASWLGACVARFAAILPDELREKDLGVRMFETYPAASLQRRFGKDDPDVKQYKLADKNKKQIAIDARQGLSRRLGITCEGQALTHDELDAVICALAAIATPQYLLTEREYNLQNSYALPTGYRVLNKTTQFGRIKARREPFDKWAAKDSRLQ